MKSNATLSIITPVYNEEEIIVSCVLETYENAKPYFDDIEYIIVNDGSIDKSLELIKTNFSEKSNYKIVDKINEGFGSAVVRGIKEATKDYVLCIPADSPLDKATAEVFFTRLNGTDISISYRDERKGYSKIMLLNSKIYHSLISVLFSMNFVDYNWIHLYKRKVFNTIEIESKGLFMLAEILIKAKNQGYTFQEISVVQRERLTGIATVSKPSALLFTMYEMLKVFVKFKVIRPFSKS